MDYLSVTDLPDYRELSGHPEVSRYGWLEMCVKISSRADDGSDHYSKVLRSLSGAINESYDYNCFLCSSHNPYGDGPVHKSDCPIHAMRAVHDNVLKCRERDRAAALVYVEECLAEMEQLRPKVEAFIKAGAISSFILYRHFQDDGTLLYIGQTTRSLPQRTGEHSKSSQWAKLVASSVTERFETQQELNEAEKAAIQSEHPLFNKVHNVRK